MSDNESPNNEGYGSTPWRDKSVLKDLYIGKQMTMAEVGDELGCDESTVLSWLDRNDIPTRNRGTETVIPELDDPDELSRRHHEDGQALYEIAQDLGCDRKTVNRRFRDFEIPVREPRREDFGLTKEVLKELYVDRRQTAEEIANQFDCATKTVLNRLRENGISARSQGPPDELAEGQKLREMYLGQRMTSGEIASELNCHQETVLRWLDIHDIDTRRTGPVTNGDDIVRDEDELRSLYVEQSMSLTEISSMIGCSAENVRNWLIHHGIDTRRAGAPFGEDNPRWNGGIGRSRYYGASFRRNRRKALERDGYKCRYCGMTREEHKEEYGRDLECHHIVPYDPDLPNEPQNRLENLIILCKEHHNKLQGVPIDNRMTG